MTTVKIAQNPSAQRPDLEKWNLIREQIRSLLWGQETVIDASLATFLAGGHLLLEGPPGVGKTTLAKSIADALDGAFRRIQMTSDLLPGEIVGILRPSSQTGDFEFRPGPIFTNFLLADELNRTSPKTQAALLEAMAEGAVTVDGKTYPLPKPFFVVATQNPLESHGVYPLADSQLDRFMTHLSITLPQEKDEESIYRDQGKTLSNGPLRPIEKVHSVLNLEQVLKLRLEVQKAHIEESVLKYAHEIIKETRVHPEVTAGISIRGGLQFFDFCRAYAFLQGRAFVIPDDVEKLAPLCLAHRLRLEEGIWDIEPKRRIIFSILKQIPKPK